MKPSSKKLRARAEKWLATTRREVARMPADDVPKLVHELQVHQIELEMQNEALRKTQLELEAARDRYADLFDFSPSAYLTLSLQGEILEANLSAGELLGLEPHRLLHQKFTRFVPPEAQDALYLFSRLVFNSDTRQSGELELVNAQARRLFVHVEAVRDATGPRRQCRFTFNDISERKRMERSLLENQQFVQSVVDSLAASIAIVDQEGRIVAVNERWRNFAAQNGAVPSAVSEGANYLAACGAGARAEADIAAITEGLRDMLAGRRRDFRHEYACHSPDEQRWFSLRATRFPEGSQHRVVVAHEDITERKRAEDELRRSEDRYRTLIEQSQDGLFVTDSEARRFAFVDVNSAACRMLGCSREDILGRSLLDVLAPEELPRIAAEMEKLQAGQTVLSEWRVRRKDGSLFPAELRARQIPDGRFQAVARDVTERKQAEEALRNASQFNQQIIAGAKEGIIVYGRDLRYQVWNPFMEHLTGLRASEVVGKHPREVFPFLHASGVLEQLNRVLAGHECATKEFEFQVPATGRSGWVSDTNSPLCNARGEIAGVIGVVNDISDRKRAEERIAMLDRAKTILAGVDRAIVHLADQPSLLNEICRIAVDQGGFKLAWVGFIAPDGSVKPAAQAGRTQYLKGIRVVTQDEPEGRGAVGTAIRENRPVVVEDIEQSGRMAPWQERLRQFGLHFVAAFPIRVAGKVTGAFQVYAQAAGFFDEQEVALMAQVSDDISFALTAMAEFTARKQAEASLRESEARLQAIMDHSPARIFLKDRQGRYLHFNRQIAETSHLSLEESLGKTDTQLYPPRQAAEFRASDRKVLAAGVPMDYEELVALDDGPHTFVVTKYPLRDAQGKIYALGGIATDITARKQMEETLRLSEHNLANFFNQAPIGLVWLSASGMILRANLAQLELLGYAAEEYLGQSFIKFCGEPAQGVELLKRLATQQSVHDYPMTRLRKDGTIRHVLVDANSFWSDKQFQYSSLFLRDITDRIELEKEILQAGERERQRMAQDLHDGLGQLLVGAAYLTGILCQDLARQSRPEARRLGRVLEVINEAIAQTRNLARGLHPVEAETNGLMVALAALADRTKKMFHVRCRFICRRPVMVKDNAVATHLFRIAQEAITNAIKHGRPGRIVIGLAETPSRINLAVEDDGVGIPARRRKTTGMGLRIMRYRAGMIGGSLAIQKRPGGGTAIVCTVHLPAAAGGHRRLPVAQKKRNQKD